MQLHPIMDSCRTALILGFLQVCFSPGLWKQIDSDLLSSDAAELGWGGCSGRLTLVKNLWLRKICFFPWLPAFWNKQVKLPLMDLKWLAVGLVWKGQLDLALDKSEDYLKLDTTGKGEISKTWALLRTS